jgi:hypothetical protein
MESYGAVFPLAGKNYTTSLMWETPQTLTDMGDDGRIAAFTANGTDGRNYSIQFDVIDWAGTLGNFTFNSLSVSTFEAAEDLAVTMTKVWDGAAAGPSFADWFGYGGLELYPGPVVLGPGTFTKTDGSFTMGIGTSSPALTYEKANGDWNAAANLQAAVGIGALKMTLASTNVAATPILRLTIDQKPKPIQWIEDWGANTSYGAVKDNGSAGVGQPVGAINPGVPTAAGSNLTSYFVITDVAAGDFMQPQVSTWSLGAYGGSNAWDNDNGAFTFTYFALGACEVLQ